MRKAPLCLPDSPLPLIALGVPSKMQDVVLGVMLIIVMGIALNNKRISGFFERKARRKELMKRA